MGELSMASKFLACRLCHAATECNNCCEKCTDQCNRRPRCYQNLTEKTLVQLAHINNKPEGTTMEVDQEILRWLTNMPEGDVNFKSNLERANEATIRAALDEVGGKVGKKVCEVALKRQLKKLLEATAEQTKGTETRQTRAVALNVGELQAERERQLQVTVEQAEREKRIAESHEIAGRIQALTFMEKVLTVSTLMQLKGIKESKVYTDLPNIGTWDKYCEYLGFSRQKVDMDLKNLAEFGEQFLLTVGGFGLGYREMRQLRQLKYDGESFSMSEDGKTIVIEGETISLTDDSAPEIEAALEKLLVRNKTLRERNTKLEKEFGAAVKEETAGYLSKEKTLVARVHELEKYEPKDMNEAAFEEQYKEIHELTASLATKISQLMGMDTLSENPVLMTRVEGFVESASGLIDRLREEWSERLQFENK